MGKVREPIMKNLWKFWRPHAHWEKELRDREHMLTTLLTFSDAEQFFTSTTAAKELLPYGNLKTFFSYEQNSNCPPQKNSTTKSGFLRSKLNFRTKSTTKVYTLDPKWMFNTQQSITTSHEVHKPKHFAIFCCVSWNHRKRFLQKTFKSFSIIGISSTRL